MCSATNLQNTDEGIGFVTSEKNITDVWGHPIAIFTGVKDVPTHCITDTHGNVLSDPFKDRNEQNSQKSMLLISENEQSFRMKF